MASSQLSSLMTLLADVEDPRVERAQRHSLLALVAIALCGVIGGAESWVEIAQCGQAKTEWFTTCLDRPSGISSHETFGLVFAWLDAQPFAAGFTAWRQAVAMGLPAQGMACDGRTGRRSHDRAKGQAARQRIGAWATAKRLLLAHGAVDNHSHEITALPLLVRQGAVTGCLVTSAALGGPGELAEPILAQAGEDGRALQDNQPTIYEEVRETCTLARASGFADHAPAVWSTWRPVPKGPRQREVRDH
jgi:hypothetical protein